MTIIQGVAVVVIGAVVGVLPGLFGVGGGFVLVPALNILAGVPLNVAVGSAACQTLGPATAGLLHRYESGQLRWQFPLTMGGGTLVGVLLGLEFLEWAKQPGETWEVAGRSVSRLDATLLSCYFVLLTVLTVAVALEWFFSRNLQPGARRGWLAWLHLPPMGSFDDLDGRSFSLTIITLLAVVVGFLTGGLGMGGNIFLVPALVFFVGMRTRRAISVALVNAWIMGFGATCAHALRNNINLGLVCLLLVGGAVGGKIGSLIGEGVPPRRLRGWFALLVAGMAVWVGFRLYGLIWGAP